MNAPLLLLLGLCVSLRGLTGLASGGPGGEGGGEDGGDTPLRIHSEFPVDSAAVLSPPTLHDRVHDCARVVYASGFIPHALVTVYVGTELVGQSAPPFGFSRIALDRELEVGEAITATQTVYGVESARSAEVIVGPYPELSTPEIHDEVYECGRIVRVGNLTESARVELWQGGVVIGETDAARRSEAVGVKPLETVKGPITARQVACPEDGADSSEMSEEVPVKPNPDPLPAPRRMDDLYVVGNDMVAFDNLLVGAQVDVLPRGSGGGLASGDANRIPIRPPVQPGDEHRATQQLCGDPSDSSTSSGGPFTRLDPPLIVGPVCSKGATVRIRNTIINSSVVLFRDGNIAGYGGAVPGDLTLPLANQQKLLPGDKVTVRQYMGPTISPPSPPVRVGDVRLGVPSYFVPGAAWTTLEDAYPAAGIAVINPNDGPGDSFDPAYVDQVRKSREAGLLVLGYLATWGGADPEFYAEEKPEELPLSRADLERKIQTDLERYFEWYPELDGLFLDQAPNWPGDKIDDAVAYYAQSVIPMIRDRDWFVVIDAGSGVQSETEQYMDLCDVFVSFEGVYSASDAGEPDGYYEDPVGYNKGGDRSWEEKYPACRFWHLVHSVPNSAAARKCVQLSKSRNAGWIHVTERTRAMNEWNPLSGYWADLVDEVENQ